MDKALVITTISDPTPSMYLHAEACGPGCRFIVVGDQKTPRGWQLEGAEFLSLERQGEVFGEFSSLLPVNHYSRKNLGYLIALRSNVGLIAESDDDNRPLGGWLEKGTHQEARAVGSQDGWVNPYEFFGAPDVWPRGFPLSLVSRTQEAVPPPATDVPSEGSSGPEVGVIQYLAGGDPDVDAVYRLTRTRVDRSFVGQPVRISHGSVAPFNSQSTVWPRHECFPLLYLPSLVPFRMTDIWRSFVAQACMRAMGLCLEYREMAVFQERNPHDLMRDFADEVSGYLRNEEIVRTLMDLDLTGDPGMDMLTCYRTLIAMDVVPREELPIIQAWLKHF